MYLIYLFLLFLLPINSWGQEPESLSEAEIAKRKRLRLVAKRERTKAEITFSRMVPPTVHLEHLSSSYKEELIQAKKRHKEQALLPNETLKSLEDKIEELEELYLQIRNEHIAYVLARQSESIEDNVERAILAKEAYEIGVTNVNHYIRKPAVYTALYNALVSLNKRINQGEDPFNELNVLPEGKDKMGIIRSFVVGKEHGVVYTIGASGLLLKHKLGISNGRKKQEKPQIIAENIRFSREIDGDPTTSCVAVVGDSDSILIYDMAYGKKVQQLRSVHQGKRIWALKYLPSGAAIITAGDEGTGGTSIVSTTLNGQHSVLIDKTTYRITKIDVSMDGRYLAMVGKSPQLQIFSIKDQEYAYLLESDELTKNATTVAFHPTKELVGVGYQDGTVAIWDLIEMSKKVNYKPYTYRAHDSKISEIVFSENGELMAAGSLDRTATIWEIGKSQKALYLEPKYIPVKVGVHSDWVTSIAFSKDNNQLITGTSNGSIMIWEIDPSIYASQICSKLDKTMNESIWKKYLKTDDPEGKEQYLNMPNHKRRTPNMTCAVVTEDLE